MRKLEQSQANIPSWGEMAHSTQAAHGHMQDYEGHVEAVEADLEYWRTKRLEPRVLQLHRRGVVTLYDLLRAAAHVPVAPAPAEEATHVNAIDWLAATVRAAARERTLKAGQALFRRGNRTSGLYEIVEGQVRLVRVNRAGREAVLHVATAGDTMAEASLFSASYHCDAIATTDAVVRLYPKAAILAEFDRNPKAAQKFAAVLARQVMTLRTHLEHRNIRAARDRVRHYLAINADADGRTVTLSGTLKDVASELGLTHEALYRALAEMAADGEIERRRGAIRVLKSAI